ncbi:hypothetical protein [Metabacillus fastidiosus]|uniref:hypothetical protein n=1 Tax=Metabacillus fastidiosus TaxID=1458 RepID=UPI003D265352
MQKPEKNFISFYSREGSFNWLNPKEMSIQYVLSGISKEEMEANNLPTLSFLVDPEHDYGLSPDNYTALELLQELDYIYNNKYFFNTRTKDSKALLEYLESVEEEQQKKRQEYEIENAKYQIHYWTQKLDELTA